MTSIPLWPLASAVAIVLVLTLLIPADAKRWWVLVNLASALWLLVGLVACLARGYFESEQWIHALLVAPMFGLLWAVFVFMTPSLFGKLIEQRGSFMGSFRMRTSVYSLDSRAQSRRHLTGTWGALVVILIMAGGVLILLGLNFSNVQHHKANFIATGMHGGVIYLRGSVDEYQLGKEVGVTKLDEHDQQILQQYVGEFAAHFGYDAAEILKHEFTKLFPLWLRPYGRLYTY